MPLAVRVLIGLVAGFLLGLALASSGAPAAAAVAEMCAPVGALFVNAIRMTTIPLVVSMLIASVGAMNAPAGLGRAGVRAVVLAVLLLAAAATGSILIAQPVLATIRIDEAAALAMRVSTSTPPAAAQTTGALQWVTDLVSPNLARAAVDGAVLPLIVFAVLFGLALARGSDDRRTVVLRVVEGIAEAMQRLVGWILQTAPLGVFALAVPLAFRLGLSALGAVAAYVVLVVVLTVVAVALLLYPLGIVVGRMRASAFISLCASPQALAFASRSSLATLPAMVESAERAQLPAAATRLVLPVATSVFHVGTAVAQAVGVLFLAHLYGVPLTSWQLASVAVTVVFTSFAVPGIPGGSIIAIVPVLAAADVPVDGIGILLAVDTIPDMFRTSANVTGAMALAASVRSAEK